MTTLESLEARVEQLEADIPTRRGCVTHLEGLQRTQRYTNDRLSALDLRMSNVEAKRGEPAYPVQTTNLAHEGCDEDLRDMGRRHGRLFAGFAVAAVAVVALVYGLSASGLIGGMTGGDDAPASGRMAFVSDRGGDAEIYVMNADGSGIEQLTDNESGDNSPSWSPNGERIAFLSDRDNDEDIYDIYVMNADGSHVQQLTDRCNNHFITWSPDGGHIAFESRGDIYVMNADGSGVGQLTGRPQESCAEAFLAVHDGEAGYFRRNADGSLELVEDYGSLDWHTVDSSPVWSPNGDRIAFVSGRGGDGFGVYVMNADGGGVERLTYDEDFNLLPSWSPEGNRIAFVSGGLDFFGDMGIYVMNADGGGVERLTDKESPDSSTAWSPDGGRIAFASNRDGDSGIYIMNADGGGVVRLAEGHSPSWSP